MMSPLERVRTACSRERPDRVPVGPFTGYSAARLLGAPLGRYVRDGALIAAAQTELRRQTGQDIVVTAADTYYIAEGFGLRTRMHADALPTCEAPLFQDLKDAAGLRPLDPYRDGRMPVYLDAVRYLTAAGGDAAIRGTGTGPFSLAAYLFGMQDFLARLADIETGEADPEDERRVWNLLEVMAETLVAFLKAQLECGAHLLYLGDSLASSEMISPATYRRFVQPWHRRIFEEIGPLCHACGAFTLLHICGDNRAVLQDFAATGADILEIDQKLDLAWCRETVGQHVTLCGNLDPAGVLRTGSPEDVRCAARQCIVQAGTDGGFILGSGCFVMPDCPVENLRAMVEAAEACALEERNTHDHTSG